MTETRAKRLAKVRDRGRCLICGRDGAWSLHGHHILPKALYPELIAEVRNIATLCPACHIQTVHAGSPRDGGNEAGEWLVWRDQLRFLIEERSRRARL